MNEITVKGLRVEACHGVLPQEKVTPQPFVFDMEISCDTTAAAKSDDLSLTVNYGEVCRAVNGFCLGNSFNLIETLSHGAAFMLAGKFPQISKVTVTVHKPQAPVGLPFSDVSVSSTVERNTVILSLGSSMGDRQAALNFAIKSLGEINGVTVEKVSGYIATKPYGGVAENEFLNCAVKLNCLLPPRSLLEKIHVIESAAGRVRGKRWGDRTLDIDIVFFGGKIIAEEGLCVPHPDYFNRPFVLVPIKQIAPDFVCPLLHKRMSDF
ncbi:MAG: 2-amino-4-hydroxy-6-hydroxymethyldihydropteridine diphosphokinase [Roseburia sp.]|nr:2-amino-4-hydroxy-6-hydroxymethyldihydropteridine diphosphokinase [Roseburia sp.]